MQDCSLQPNYPPLLFILNMLMSSMQVQMKLPVMLLSFQQINNLTLTDRKVSSSEFHIYVDGAQKDGQGAVGGFISKQGQIHISWSLFIGTRPSPAYAEARAIYEGILKCDQLQINNAIIHTDSQLLWWKMSQPVQYFKYEWRHLYDASINMSSSCHLYDACINMSSSLNIRFVKIVRRQNKLADCLANLGLKSVTSYVWWDKSPLLYQFTFCLILSKILVKKIILFILHNLILVFQFILFLKL